MRIEDRGPGIRTKSCSHFDPFFSTKQADSQGGMGLGFSVSRSLIEAMGGRIKVTSKPGREAFFGHLSDGVPAAETVDVNSLSHVS